MPIVLPSMARPTLTEPAYVAPPAWKPVLAWAGLVVGGLVVVAALGTLGSGVIESVAMALIGLAMAVPGGWWVHCEREDRTRAEEDFLLDRQSAEAARSMSGYVSPDALSPLTWSTPLAPFVRRWPVVGAVSVAMLVLGAALMPTPEPAATPASSPVAATSTVTTTARATAPTTTAPTTLSQAPASSPESATPVATGVPQSTYAPVPEPAPEPTYAPPQTYAPAPLAEPVQQATYYPNCSAARAAGAAPLYRGQPGYASKLDRDNDGVACE
ncbi:excalibur calcium-binding domain-containing protein [Dietzia sp. B32]|uniref:excalibur calcium-binding domain-containing protein n=1 Tax=Dietzia sp. B32 TaxID=2915130 RepID=UPI0021AD667A|nr:excalibur calcium-binding domain-containing protein [Dietzia sp. B32]UVE95937.1 excalibur calcium-binding domain-containing protein [Dietzia sp. B32]